MGCIAEKFISRINYANFMGPMLIQERTVN